MLDSKTYKNMNISEIYLLTAFVCSACDGDIAPEEVALVKKWSEKNNQFGDIDVQSKLNDYVRSINKNGSIFLRDYLQNLKNNKLSKEEQIEIIRIAIEMIEADGQILYSEIKFFKKIRPCLSLTDEEILEVMPDKEDFLLPDIKTTEFFFDDEIKFEEINFSNIIKND